MKKLLLLTAVITAMASCNSSQHQANMTLPAFDKEGHRGCRGLMPENTIPAMLKALDLGVTTLEMDICFSKDKKALLSHEPFFNHEITTTPDGSFIEEKDEKNYKLFELNYSDITHFDVGMKPHPRFPQQQKLKAVKPLLADVFDAVSHYMKQHKRPFPFFNIETKTNAATDNTFHPAPAEFVELLMQVIKAKKMERYVIIQSFDFRTLQYLHLHYPAMKTAMLIEDYDKRSLKEQLDALGFLPTIYSPEQSLVTAELITACHQQNIKVIPWTVDDKKDIDHLKTMGVDGIISDYPNLFNE
ncbi:MAG: glycerophosphodiester phosphodiesterase [Bacteroidetes bacterium]|nr:glycerophosphodiester phosphodiesterase [Bacteroidota bacterium]